MLHKQVSHLASCCSPQFNYPIWPDILILRGDIMPRGDFNIHFASRGGGLYVRAEEAAGIALLVIILAALLMIGCWYYRRRNGYKMIQTQNAGQSWRAMATSGQYRGEGEAAGDKVALKEFSNLRHVVPNAPPAYEKISSGLSPPPYSP
ncbi:hypothetical protein SKAU_G00357890 [Synaphobranchus kaupii]|uniref:Melan-A n=1 Tax=Synaphobranchus kaupii TaxID=118154 RepID=A0A9Q1EHP3_SYNKA|nr:hypothetical protein SKAU_G00357890 [Synaphobranchus kaupii]